MADTVLVFRLARQVFALPAQRVRECLPLPALRQRPGLAPHVAGFLELGGAAHPVVDLAVLLGLRERGAGPSLEAGGLYRHLLLLDAMALLVDRAMALAEPSPAPSDLEADPWQHGCISRRLIVDGEPVALLDPDRLLQDHERERLRLLTEAVFQRSLGWVDGADAG